MSHHDIPYAPLPDRRGRPLASLRLSVTDRCNLRCAYCMPEDDYVWLQRDKLLTFEEIARTVDVFTRLGVRKLRLTGGEPLVRRDLPELVARLARNPHVEDLALTTNGLLLADHAADLAKAGLGRVTVSIDTLQPKRFAELCRRDSLDAVFAGIEAVRAAGLRVGFKLDTVVMRGVNDDELVDLVEFARGQEAEVRFIEYMDVGGATNWDQKLVVSRAEILETMRARYGTVEAATSDPAAPADRFRLPDGTVFGIIASTTEPFCAACDRSRLTADGTWFHCLYARTGTDLRTPLRDGATDADLEAIVRDGWSARDDHGAEERLAERERGPLAATSELRENPHLEMHTRGG